MNENDIPTNSSSPKKKSNLSGMLLEIAISVLLPTLILKKLSGDDSLGAMWALVFALALPLSFGFYQFLKAQKFGFIPILGFINILLTGGIGLLELDSGYIAIKEAAIPLIIAILTLASLKTPYPLVKTFLYNDMVLQIEKINAALTHKNNFPAFEQTLNNATYMLASSFLLSSILNYALAKVIVTAASGTPEFNDQLGTMNLLSYPVIVLPCMVITMGTLFYLFKRIQELTGYKLEEILNEV